MKSEKELASIVIKNLSGSVYQEVKHPFLGCRSDIVCVENERAHFIECKIIPNIHLLYQAARWLEFSHYVSVAFKKLDERKPQYKSFLGLAHILGVGIMFVSGNTCFQYSKPLLNEPKVDVRRFLREYHQGELSVAGSKSQYFTPFKQTCLNLYNYVCSNPGCELLKCVSSIDHHYTNDDWAKENLWKYILSGVIDLEFKAKGKKVFLYSKQK